MLECGTYNSTCDMAIAEEGYGRRGDSVWFQKPVADGGAVSMCNASSAQGDGLIFADKLSTAYRGCPVHNSLPVWTQGYTRGGLGIETESGGAGKEIKSNG